MTSSQRKHIAKLYSEMYDPLLSYALSVLPSPSQAEEAVQDTFQIACQKADEVCSSPNPKGWLTNTLKNVIGNELRQRMEFSSLQQALDKCNISQKLAPTWMPEGYILAELILSDSPNENTISSKYINGVTKDELTITIRQILSGPLLSIEKSNDLVEIYSCDDIAYYIFSNCDRVRAVWVVEEFECLITGNISIADLKNIIDSIY